MKIHPALILPFLAQPKLALALDYRGGLYRRPGRLWTDAGDIAGLTHTQSGACWEIGPDGELVPFGANEPRVVPGLGLWCRGSFTNLAVRSAEFDNASWAKVTSSVSADTEIAPDGNTAADTVTATTTTVNNGMVRQGVAGTFGAFTFGAFGKAGSSSGLMLHPNSQIDSTFTGLRATYDLESGAVAWLDNYGGKFTPGSLFLREIAGGWKRPALSYAIAGAAFNGSHAFWIYPYLNGDANGVNAHLWGATLYAGSQPGPIIATGASAASNGAATHTLAFAQRDEDFTLLVSFNLAEGRGGPALRAIALMVNSASPGTDKVHLFLTTGGAVNGVVRVANVAQSVGGFSSGAIAEGRGVAAIRYRAGRYTLAEKIGAMPVNIGSEGASAILPPGLDQLRIGHQGVEQLNGVIEAVEVHRGQEHDNGWLTAQLERLAA